MIRLIANTDIGSISFTSRSHTNVARIVVAPTATGSSAATTLRKTTSDSRNSSGKASISARARSCSICSLTCMKASRPPPAVTPGSRSTRSFSRSAAASSSTPARKVASR